MNLLMLILKMMLLTLISLSWLISGLLWCGPCKAIAPIIEEIAEDYKGKVKVGKVDVDQNQNSAMKFGVRSIPTLLILKNGEVVNQIVGSVPKSEISEKLDTII